MCLWQWRRGRVSAADGKEASWTGKLMCLWFSPRSFFFFYHQFTYVSLCAFSICCMHRERDRVTELEKDLVMSPSGETSEAASESSLILGFGTTVEPGVHRRGSEEDSWGRRNFVVFIYFIFWSCCKFKETHISRLAVIRPRWLPSRITCWLLSVCSDAQPPSLQVHGSAQQRSWLSHWLFLTAS